MINVFRQYGTIVDIFSYEKQPHPQSNKKRAVNVLAPYEGRPCYRPRRYDSVLRAKKICLRRVSCALAKFGRPLFLTLTFSGSASDVGLASQALASFQRRLRVEYPDAVSLFVPELSPRGRIHFHGLVFNLPLAWGDKRVRGRVVSIGLERKNRTLAKLWGVGFVDCRQTDGSPKLASYVSKYLGKSAENPLFNRIRLVRVSRGFPREIIIYGPLADFLVEKYKKVKETHFWHGENSWLGQMERRIFYTDLGFHPKVIHNLAV